MVKYLVNSFSLNMLPLPLLNETREFRIIVKDLEVREFCSEISDAVNALGHQGTVDLVNQLCGSNLTLNRTEVKLNSGDVAIVVQVLTRLSEGKMLTVDEVVKMYKEGKIRFFKVRII